jgi:hypothetical protein
LNGCGTSDRNPRRCRRRAADLHHHCRGHTIVAAAAAATAAGDASDRFRVVATGDRLAAQIQ